jgi:hypothetical protein
MTKSQIIAECKLMQDNGYSNFEILHMVISENIKYPDAVFLVSQALRLDSEEMESMEDDYSFNA